MNKKADESGDEITFTEEATEFQPGETELATNYTEKISNKMADEMPGTPVTGSQLFQTTNYITF